jgi:hypothetical protein
MRARDSQRQKVYEWGWAMAKLAPGCENMMSLEATEAYVAQVWRDYTDSQPPRITDGRGKRLASGGMYHIALPTWARNPATILHEVSHSLVERLHTGVDHAWHGPEYARCLLELYARYLKVPKSKAIALAKQHRVKIGAAAACPRPMSQIEKNLRAEVVAMRSKLKLAEAALADYRAKKKGA